MKGEILGPIAFALAAGAITIWTRRMRRVALANRRSLPFSMCAAAVALAAIALADEPGWVGGAFAIMGLLLGLVWISLGILARQSSQAPNVVVGRPLPAIAAPDAQGVLFDVASLRGHPVLIKLFRGHW